MITSQWSLFGNDTNLEDCQLVVIQSRLRSFESRPRAKATRSSAPRCSCTVIFRSPWWILRDAGPPLTLNGALGKKSRRARKKKRAGSLASLLYIGHSMIPAEEQGGWSRIFYLHTTNCSSFSQPRDYKDCLSCHTFIYIHIIIYNLFCPPPPFFLRTRLFSVTRKRNAALISAPPRFLSHTTNFSSVIPLFEPKQSPPFSYHRPFAAKAAKEQNNSFCARAEKSALNKAVGKNNLR